MSRPASITGVHHLKLPVSNIATSKSFYYDILGLEHIAEYDHIDRNNNLFGVILKKNTAQGPPLLVELRLNPDQAKKQKHWDPVVWSVPLRKDLDEWGEWFESRGVKSSRVMTGIKGWVLSILDPDEKFVRLYCEESHEWTKDTDEDDFWLGN